MAKGLPRSLAHSDKALELIEKNIDLSGFTVTVTSVTTGIGGGSVVVDTLPETDLILFGALGKELGFDGSGEADLTETWEGDVSLGTSADADLDLTSPASDENLLPSTAIGPATSKVITGADVAQTAANLPGTFLGVGSARDVNLNLLVDAADIADDGSAVVTLSGVISLYYVLVGDVDRV